MAQFNGYVKVAHATYQQFRDATLGNGYNVDKAYGNQCWDFCALLWWQYGLILHTGPKGWASECWTVSRSLNAVPPFTQVTSISDIKRGDCVVFKGTSNYPTGHIAFADEDYKEGMTRMNFLGQNQGQGNLKPSNIANISLANFIGAFRNSNWVTPKPTPENDKKHKFPWAVAWRHWDNFKRF